MSVFVLPEHITKTQMERVVPLNAVARSVIESRRGMHPEYVFTYRGKPVCRLHNIIELQSTKRAFYSLSTALQDMSVDFSRFYICMPQLFQNSSYIHSCL